jgi:hypothetical protein
MDDVQTFLNQVTIIAGARGTGKQAILNHIHAILNNSVDTAITISSKTLPERGIQRLQAALEYLEREIVIDPHKEKTTVITIKHVGNFANAEAWRGDWTRLLTASQSLHATVILVCQSIQDIPPKFRLDAKNKIITTKQLGNVKFCSGDIEPESLPALWSRADNGESVVTPLSTAELTSHRRFSTDSSS